MASKGAVADTIEPVTGLPTSPWLGKTCLLWLHALEDENSFAESVIDGVAVRDRSRTLTTQARLGYSWSHLAHLYPHQTEFARAAQKSFWFLQHTPEEDHADFRVYDQSFYLLFMAWYYRVSNDPAAIRLLMNRYSDIERHFDNAGAGGFGTHPAGTRSHNPYMHLLEAVLAAFQSTHDDFWLVQARRIRTLFTDRLLVSNNQHVLVFEFRNPDWTVAADRRVEIGHQLEWSTLLLELSAIDGPAGLASLAQLLHRFAMQHGFESGLAIDAVNSDGTPMDRRKLLWSQLEAARHFSVRARIAKDAAARLLAEEQWGLIRERFFRPNGWSWYNRLTADGQPVDEPSNARLLYHVVTAAAEC